jgi:phage gp45-like
VYHKPEENRNMERITLARAGRQSQMGTSRATIRSIDDEHLMQNVKEADGFHSETISNEGAPFERFQMVGLTSIPLKQFEEEGQGSQQANKSNQANQQADDGFDNNQPKGKSAEAVMLFLNGSRSHPVALVDDRRVRPYKMKEGDTALYHASGTEQKVYVSDQGAMLVANNNPSEEKNAQQKDRYASLRHVSGEKQKRELKKGQKPPDHKHEGATVNCEIRCTKDRIEFRDGDTVVGYYDKGGKKWFFTGSEIENVATTKMKNSSETISNVVTKRFETVGKQDGKTYLGLDDENEDVPIGETDATRYKKTYVKLV